MNARSKILVTHHDIFEKNLDLEKTPDKTRVFKKNLGFIGSFQDFGFFANPELGAAIGQFEAAMGQLGTPKCQLRATMGQVGAPTGELGAPTDKLGAVMGK